MICMEETWMNDRKFSAKTRCIEGLKTTRKLRAMIKVRQFEIKVPTIDHLIKFHLSQCAFTTEPFTELGRPCQHHPFARTVIALVENRNAFARSVYLPLPDVYRYSLTLHVAQYDTIVG